MSNMKTHAAMAALAATLLIGACASNEKAEAPAQSVADKMEAAAQPFEAEATARQLLAEQWRKGDVMTRTGDQQQIDAKARIRRAERDIEKAERELRRQQQRLDEAQKALADAKTLQVTGRDMVEEGRLLRAAAESEFRSKYPGVPLN